MSQLNFIQSYLTKESIHYLNDLDEDSINTVYHLYANDKVNEITILSGVCANYIALYYDIKREHQNMKKYYKLAIEKGNAYAMYNLGRYYDTHRNYEKMKKYYLMAIEHGIEQAMYGLGRYYEFRQDYDKMKDYYLMAIKSGNKNAMYQLALHYQCHDNIEYMLKYYQMAIQHGSVEAMEDMVLYCIDIQKFYDMMKYLLMITELRFPVEISIIDHKNDNWVKNKMSIYISNPNIIIFILNTDQTIKTKIRQLKEKNRLINQLILKIDK